MLSIIFTIIQYILILLLIGYIIWYFLDKYTLKDLSDKNDQYKIAIVGTGYSGILAGIKLREVGITNFVIFEEQSAVGGTWQKNVYPGCECDVMSHMYSYSFELNSDWHKKYPSYSELQQYIEKVSKKYKIYDHIKLNTQVVEQNYDESKKQWILNTKNLKSNKQETSQFNFVLGGYGGLNVPFTPEFKGKNEFKGKQMHTALYDLSYNLQGKNVAVIGSAASAIQLIPEVQKLAKKLIVFQRTPNYILPKGDGVYPGYIKAMFKYLPFIQKIYRYFLYFYYERNFLFFNTGKTNDKVKQQALDMILPQITKLPQDLQKKLIPSYRIGCKRVLIHDNYYQAFGQNNVILETQAIKQFTENSVITSENQEYKDIDCIIYATGFKVASVELTINGRKGHNLRKEWETDQDAAPEAYFGSFMPNYPNFSFIMGPNTGLGHHSYIYMLEANMRHIMKLLEHVISNNYKEFEVKQQAFDDEQTQLIKKEQKSVWILGGCQSWYKNSKRLFALHVGFAFQFWLKMRNFNSENFNYSK